MTEIQKDTINEIKRFQKEKGYPPTLRELAMAFKVALPTMQNRVEGLRRNGWITWEPGKARTFRVTGGF